MKDIEAWSTVANILSKLIGRPFRLLYIKYEYETLQLQLLSAADANYQYIKFNTSSYYSVIINYWSITKVAFHAHAHLAKFVNCTYVISSVVGT